MVDRLERRIDERIDALERRYDSRIRALESQTSDRIFEIYSTIICSVDPIVLTDLGARWRSTGRGGRLVLFRTAVADSRGRSSK